MIERRVAFIYRNIYRKEGAAGIRKIRAPSSGTCLRETQEGTARISGQLRNKLEAESLILTVSNTLEAGRLSEE